MTSPVHGALRGVRAGAFGGVAFSLSLAAHAAAGGPVPGRGVLLATAAGLAMISVLFTGRRLGRFAVGAALCGSQLVLHELFMFLAAGGSCTAGTAGTMTPGMPMAGVVGPVGLGSCAPAMASMPLSGPMIAAHVAATLLTAAVLARGEQAVWVLATWALVRVRLPGRLPAAMVPGRPARPAAEWGWALTPAVATSGLGRRGPPNPGPVSFS